MADGPSTSLCPVPSVAGSPASVTEPSHLTESSYSFMENIGGYLLTLANAAFSSVANISFAAVVLVIDSISPLVDLIFYIFDVVVYQPMINPVVRYLFSEPPLIRGRPLPLKNAGNSCFMAATLQCFLCSRVFVNQFLQSNPMPTEPANPGISEGNSMDAIDYNQLGQVHDYISEMIRYLHGSDQDKDEMDLRYYRPSLRALRQALFNSKAASEPDLKNQRYISSQQDPLGVVDFLENRYLEDYKFFLQKHITLPNGDDAEMTRDDSVLVFQLGLSGQSQTLKSVIDDYFHLHIVEDELALESNSPLNPGDEEIKVNSYLESYTVTNLPPLLTLQFKRFESHFVGNQFVPLKINSAIDLEDGVLDLSPYYSGTDEESGFYKVISTVNHSGSLANRGHYIAQVEMNGGYYRCDDANISDIQSREEFLRNTQGYIIVLERITKEEADDLRYRSAS